MPSSMRRPRRQALRHKLNRSGHRARREIDEEARLRVGTPLGDLPTFHDPRDAHGGIGLELLQHAAHPRDEAASSGRLSMIARRAARNPGRRFPVLDLGSVERQQPGVDEGAEEVGLGRDRFEAMVADDGDRGIGMRGQFGRDKLADDGVDPLEDRMCFSGVSGPLACCSWSSAVR